MTVSVTPSPLPSYTWATAGWSWSDPRALASWAAANPTSYAVAVGEAVATAEAVSETYTQPQAEAFTTSEGVVEGYGLNPSEAFATTDAPSWNFVKALAEACAFAEQSLSYRNLSLTAAEAFTTSDSQAFTFSQAIAELFATLESFSDSVLGRINFSESLGIVDQAGTAQALLATEFFGFTDLIPSPLYVTQFSSGSFNGAAVNNSPQLISIVAGQPTLSAVTTSQSRSFNALPINQNTLPPVIVSTGIAHQYGLDLAEAFATAEALGTAANFYLALAEAMGTSDAASDERYVNFNEATTFQEVLAHVFASNPNESLTVGELLASGYAQNAAESFTTSDVESKIYGMTVGEAVHFLQAFIRRANAVYSNMVLNSNDLTQTAFDDLVDNGKVVGYDRFHDFIPGDYTYQQALFRAILNSANADRARLNKLMVTVDVPDVFDRGEVTIPPGSALTGVVVTFNRTFTIIPEVTLTLKGGTVIGYPRVLTPSTANFTAILIDPGTSLGVAGVLTWAAHGY